MNPSAPPIDPRPVLVTGAAGFVGSHVVEALLARGTEVIGLDNFDPYYPRAFKEANLAVARTDPRFTFAEADVTDAGAVAALPPFGAIIHLAAKAGVRPSIANSLAYQQVNLIGTQLVLDACRARGVEQVVFGSSSSVYGLNPAYPWSESDQRLAPISPYASSKLSAEMLGATYAHLFGIRFIALRYFTVFGPRQRPDLAINSFVDKIMAGQPLTRYGSGDTLRDYTYVSDIVAGTLAALDYRRTNFERINLGGGRPTSLQELIAGIERALGRSATIEEAPEQPGDLPVTHADISKARRLLGYTPLVSIPEGLRLYVDWVRQRQDSSSAVSRAVV